MHLSLPESPFIRIAVPLIAGIALYNCANLPTPAPALILLIPAIMLYVIVNAIKNLSIRYKINGLYPIIFFCLYVSAGWILAYANRPPTLNKDLLNHKLFLVADIKSIEHKNVTTDIISECNIEGQYLPLIITLRGNDYKLRPGDRICCHSEIERIKSSTVPEAFDYASYMRHKGFSYRTFVDKGNYSKIGHHDNLQTKSLEIKNSIISHLLQTHLNHRTINFIIAILTGNDDYISDETRESFSQSGLAHILAVSGLHISIIGLLIAFFLKPLDYAGFRNIRLTLSILSIWAFTYIIGMPPSACRAAIMTTFLLVAIILHKKHNIMNALAASAVFILILNPYSLYNAGFQLSYLSVAGIILFADKLTLFRNNKFVNKITAVISVSIAAQLGTAIVAIYYFNMLSLTFLIGNTIVVPILPVFMLLSIIIIAFSYIGITVGCLDRATDILYDCFIGISDYSNSIPYSLTDNIWIDGTTAVCLSAAILLIGLWLNTEKRQQRKTMLYLSIIAAFTGCLHLTLQNKTRMEEGIFLTDGYSSTNIVYYCNNRAFVMNSKNDTSEITSFINANRRFFIKHRTDSIIKINGQYHDNTVYADYPYICIRDKRFAFATGNINKRQAKRTKTELDYLIITNNYYNDIKSLNGCYTFSQIIIPNEIYDPAHFITELGNSDYIRLSEQNLHIHFR